MFTPQSSSDVFKTWWKAPEDTVHGTITGLVGTIRSQQQTKRAIDRFHMRLYSNNNASGTGVAQNSAMELLTQEDGRMRYRLSTSVVNTAVPIVTANKPIPYFLPDGGSFSDQRKAKRRTKLIQGQFWDLNIYDLAPLCARDAMVIGLGALYAYVDPDTGKVAVERVLPGELMWDHAEALAGDPRSLYRLRLMSREKLISLAHELGKPELEDKLVSAEGPSVNDWKDFFLQRDGTADIVVVVEAWHRPSRPGAKDGRRVICTSSCTLVDEDYEHDAFPFAFCYWAKRMLGLQGESLVEETKDAQLRINRLIKCNEKSQDLASGVHVWVEQGSQVQPNTIKNAPAQIHQYVGRAPVFYKHEGTLDDLVRQIESIREQTFSMVGLSQQQLQGERPAGLNSAPAQREAESIASRRHLANVKQYETFFSEICKLLERTNDDAQKIAKAKGKTYYVTSVESRGRTDILTKVAWEDVRLDAAQQRMWPISSLPSTPSAKLETVQELMQGGFLSKPFAMKLMDQPDLDAAMSIELADLENVLWYLERIEDGENGVMPHPMQNLQMALELSRKTFVRDETLGADKRILNNLQKFYDATKKLIEKTQQPAQAPGQAAPAQSPGMQPVFEQKPQPVQFPDLQQQAA